MAATHKHNDFSCYIHVVNRTDFDLELVESKALKGTWANGTPPKRIVGNSTALIELTDPKGPHGSKGMCKYAFNHPGRKSSPVTFRLKFEDPYWGTDDNYLHATSQYTDYVTLNVKKYAASGHPFSAYVEVQNPRPSRQFSRRSTRSTNDTASSVISSNGDDDSFAVESPSPAEKLPGYPSRSDSSASSNEEPVRDIEPVKNNADADQHKHNKTDSAISITYLGEDVSDKEEPTREISVDEPVSQPTNKPATEVPQQPEITIPEIISEQPAVEEPSQEPEVAEEAPGSTSEPLLPEPAHHADSNAIVPEPHVEEPKEDVVVAPLIEKQPKEHVSPAPEPVSQHVPETIVSKPQPIQDRSAHESTQPPAHETAKTPVHEPIQTPAHEPSQKPVQKSRDISTSTQTDVEKDTNLDGDYVEVNKVEPETQPEKSASKPVTAPVADDASLGSSWREVIASPHGRFGIAAFVFLTVYGITATRISRGLLLASVAR